MDITACAIVKNEEALLNPWIEHILNLPQFKEVVIVDTGSTDRSVEIVDEWINNKRPVHLHHFEWNNSFAEARNYCLNKAKDHGSEWCMMFDIDEFFNANAELSFAALEEMIAGGSITADVIQFLHVKYYKFDQMYFRTPPNKTTYKDGWIHYSDDKATMRLFKKNCIIKFGSDLHEYPIYMSDTKTELFSLGKTTKIREQLLYMDFFMIHYDLAKLYLQAERNETSLDFEIGNKRLVYRKIKAAETNGKNYTPSWANHIDPESDLGKRSIEQLGEDQYIQSIKVDGHIFPVLEANTYDINCKSLKDYLKCRNVTSN